MGLLKTGILICCFRRGLDEIPNSFTIFTKTLMIYFCISTILKALIILPHLAFPPNRLRNRLNICVRWDTTFSISQTRAVRPNFDGVVNVRKHRGVLCNTGNLVVECFCQRRYFDPLLRTGRFSGMGIGGNMLYPKGNLG